MKNVILCSYYSHVKVNEFLDIFVYSFIIKFMSSTSRFLPYSISNKLNSASVNLQKTTLSFSFSFFQGSQGVEVLLLGAFGGRFDQEMASLHVLHKW